MASSSTKNGTGDFADNMVVDDILKETKFPHRSMVGVLGALFSAMAVELRFTIVCELVMPWRSSTSSVGKAQLCPTHEESKDRLLISAQTLCKAFY
uniref:Uncharacterized protein n=1 Tax=viral metagenome TaxID=1070528 RepID=A0A6C0BZZ1_9ZZZZ